MKRSLFEARQYLTKKELCDVLGCSVRTVQRILAKNQFEVVRGAGRFDPIKIDRSSFAVYCERERVQLHFDWEPTLPPAPPSKPSVGKSPTHAELQRTEPLTEQEKQAEADRTFAEAYRQGQATDSLGNSIHGSERGSLLGTMRIERPTAPSTTSHMPQALLPNTDCDRPLESDAFLDAWRAPGTPTAAERRALMRQDTLQESDRARRMYLRAISARHPGFSR